MTTTRPDPASVFTADELEGLVSVQRFASFRQATTDPAVAVALYAWNARVSGAFAELIQHVEMLVRNAMHRRLTAPPCSGSAVVLPVKPWFDEPSWVRHHWFNKADRAKIRSAIGRAGHTWGVRQERPTDPHDRRNRMSSISSRNAYRSGSPPSVRTAWCSGPAATSCTITVTMRRSDPAASRTGRTLPSGGRWWSARRSCRGRRRTSSCSTSNGGTSASTGVARPVIDPLPAGAGGPLPISKLNDQHAFVPLPDAAGLPVGLVRAGRRIASVHDTGQVASPDDHRPRLQHRRHRRDDILTPGSVTHPRQIRNGPAISSSGWLTLHAPFATGRSTAPGFETVDQLTAVICRDVDGRDSFRCPTSAGRGLPSCR